MRVTHIITRLVLGGAQENTVASVLGLRRRPGWEVTLLSGPTRGPEGSLEALLAGIPGALTLVPSLVRPLHPWRDVRALLDLTRRLRARRPDVVHTHSGKAGVLGRWAAHRAGVPIRVHTVHGPSFGAFQGPVANALYRAAERAAACVTTQFVTVADALTEQYLAAGIGRPEAYVKILSGFDLAPFAAARNDPAQRTRWGLGPEDIVVGKIARLFKLKGHDDLLAAAPELVRRCPRLKFLLVGDGPWRARLAKQCRRLGVARQFVFAGLVPPDQIPALVGIMDLVVHLSRREGLPRALAQALAAARPVVAYDCDGAREVCLDHETGFLVQPGDRGRVVECVHRLAADPALRERLGRRGQQFVQQHFAVETMVDTLARLYERLARERGLLPPAPADAG